MGVAISGIVAALAVIFALSVTTTTTQPITSFLNLLLNLAAGTGGRLLTIEEGITALVYSVTVYLVVFSLTYFLARFFGLILLAAGVPDEDTIRDTRLSRREARVLSEMQKRQAKLIARYLIRGQQSAARRRAAASSAGLPSESGSKAVGD
jgi:hypothetical protein